MIVWRTYFSEQLGVTVVRCDVLILGASLKLHAKLQEELLSIQAGEPVTAVSAVPRGADESGEAQNQDDG